MQTEDKTLDAAKVGNMYVTRMSFQYHEADTRYNGNTSEKVSAHWEISATLNEKLSRYGGDGQTMTIKVERGIGQKLAEVLLPVIVADASRKAQQLADDSKAMIAALGERAILSLSEGAKEVSA